MTRQLSGRSKQAALREAVADIPDGASIAVGGFGICGTPRDLIRAIRDTGQRDLHVVANNCGIEGEGLGILLDSGQLRKVTCSFIGENRAFATSVSTGRVEVELVPQGTLAERLRLGGSGIPAFYTPTGVGTAVAEGGLPVRYHPDGTIAAVSAPKEVRRFDGRDYVLEPSIQCDFALVRAARGDTAGNLAFRRAARNFNPLCAMAGRVAIAEVEILVEGEDALDADEIHLPGVFIHRVCRVEDPEKPIEKVVTREPALHVEGSARALDTV